MSIIRRILGLKPKHHHVWTYTSTIAGWTLARCACGAVELA